MKMIHVRKQSLIILGVLLASFISISTVQDQGYDAYLSSSVSLWKRVVDKASASYEKSGRNEDLYQLTLVQYGLVNATMKNEEEDVFDAYAEDMEDNLDRLIEADYMKAEALALKSGLFGFFIAYSPWKGMYLGPKSGSFIEEAMELKATSPVVQKLYANQQYFTPEMWGGDIDNAERAMQKAILLFEEDKGRYKWMYLDSLAWLGLIYKDQGDYENARRTWNKALEVEPEFAWVKNALLPSLKQ